MLVPSATPPSALVSHARNVAHAARAPVIGGLFEIDAGPQAGHGDAPRAEGGVPVKTGAAFRMAVELSSPPQARMTIDTGNSGHPGSPHFDDQVEDRTLGRPTEVAPPGADRVQGRLRLLPATEGVAPP